MHAWVVKPAGFIAWAAYMYLSQNTPGVKNSGQELKKAWMKKM